MKKKKKQTCETCALGKRFYRQFGYTLDAFLYCLCTADGTVTETKASCPKWKEKTEQYDLSSARFEKANEDIAVIRELSFSEKCLYAREFRRK